MAEKFEIDFFELSFLAEACIPPRPIARSMFWGRMINDYYHQMSKTQRSSIYKWMNRNSHYQEQKEKGNEDVLIFDARYNPDNQYVISAEGKKSDAFLYNGKYYIENYPGSKATYIAPEFITDIKKL